MHDDCYLIIVFHAGIIFAAFTDSDDFIVHYIYVYGNVSLALSNKTALIIHSSTYS